jgi:hypothetical protein
MPPGRCRRDSSVAWRAGVRATPGTTVAAAGDDGEWRPWVDTLISERIDPASDPTGKGMSFRGDAGSGVVKTKEKLGAPDRGDSMVMSGTLRLRGFDGDGRDRHGLRRQTEGWQRFTASLASGSRPALRSSGRTSAGRWRPVPDRRRAHVARRFAIERRTLGGQGRRGSGAGLLGRQTLGARDPRGRETARSATGPGRGRLGILATPLRRRLVNQEIVVLRHILPGDASLDRLRRCLSLDTGGHGGWALSAWKLFRNLTDAGCTPWRKGEKAASNPKDRQAPSGTDRHPDGPDRPIGGLPAQCSLMRGR